MVRLSQLCSFAFTFFLAAAALLAPRAASAQDGKSPAPFKLQDNDVVVLIGSTFIERAQEFGHIETALLLSAGGDAANVKFRNLGWSGDTPFGDARSYFGEPKEGRERLDKLVSELKPNVVVLCYGTVAAMGEGADWTREKVENVTSAKDTFIQSYGDLIGRVKAAAGENLREIVLVSPPPLENLGAPLPDQTENNRKLAAVSQATGELAQEQGARFVDLFTRMGGVQEGPTKEPLTGNGVHYGDKGYERVSQEIVAGLGLEMPKLKDDPESLQTLNKAIYEKNRLFFHRWRPVNETYLFLFRKHEQGQNAKEIPMFDPLIRQEEKRIEDLKAAVLGRNTQP